MTLAPHRIRAALVAALMLAPLAAGAPSDQAAPVQGTLTIHAVQGTPGGPSVGPCDAEIELRHNGAVISTMSARLDEKGNAAVEGVPIGPGVIPVVTIHHADVYYLQSGELMDAANPDQEITVTCFEVTSDEPPWHIVLRHVMLVGDPHGLHVTEIVQIRSDGDRTWLGTSHASDQPITTSFSIPAEAANVQLMQGFAGWENTSRVADALYNHLPLMPGDTEFTFSYAIQSHQSEATLGYSAPVLTQHAMVIVPDLITVAGVTNLEPGGGTRIADTDVHFYMSQALPPGAAFQITVAATGAQHAAPPMGSYAEASPEEPRSGITMKWIAAGGGAIILLAAGALLLFRRGSATS